MRRSSYPHPNVTDWTAFVQKTEEIKKQAERIAELRAEFQREMEELDRKENERMAA